MISPHTPPGTKVVCLKGKSEMLTFHGIYAPDIVSGRVYTIVEILADADFFSGFGCVLAEFDDEDVFCLQNFRRIDLPGSLTSLLNVRPVDADREIAQ